MTGAAMADALDQIGAAIPGFGFCRVGLERAGSMEQRVPPRQQRAEIEWKTQLVFRRSWFFGASARTGVCAIKWAYSACRSASMALAKCV